MKDTEGIPEENSPEKIVADNKPTKRGRPVTFGGVELIGVRLSRNQFQHCLGKAKSQRQIPDYLRELIDRDMEAVE